MTEMGTESDPDPDSTSKILKRTGFGSGFGVNFSDPGQRCARAGVQESTSAGVGVFQQDPE